ncbi:MAG: hypothetical protein ABIS38_00280 [Sphingomicrobium sp.]
MSMSPAHRRYVRRIFVSMSLYIATLFVAVSQFRHGHVEGPLAWLLALLPGLCVAGVFWALGKLLAEETDEYLRSLLVRQLLIAAAITLSVATVYGFLENFGLVRHIDAFYLTMLYFIGMGVGAAVNRVSGHSGGRC